MQAKNGDCLVLEFGPTDSPQYILIDGGPYGVAEDSLDKFLIAKNLTNSDFFEVMVLSHVDDDHVIGLQKYLDWLKIPNEFDQPPKIKEVWHNYVEYELDDDGKIEYTEHHTGTRGLDDDNLEQAFKEFWKEFNEFEHSKYNSIQIPFPSNFLARSIRKGNEFTKQVVNDHKIPLNKSFGKKDIEVEDEPTVHFGDLRIDVIGPSQKMLDKLMKKWRQWLREQEKQRKLERGKDPSVTNQSSIMFVATWKDENDDEKRILFTGDGLGDHIIYGLKERGFLSDDENSYFWTDILKLPHHGSENNVTPEFFEKVRATHYVASGNGDDENPDTQTLTDIAEASKDQQRDVTIWVTYDNTPEIKAFRQACPREDGYRYEIKTVDSGEKYFTIDLS